LGIGSRHLRRLFVQHLGASPIKIATTQRVHLARKLLEESRLPISRTMSDSRASENSITRFAYLPVNHPV
jgi:AraC family transcriptional regulator of adaptative response / DNA-3-methyladenine glycosylase II